MGRAARAIIIENDQLLLMLRDKEGQQYCTLVGGQTQKGEGLEEALVREVREETGLEVTGTRMVFVEKHKAPYNEQYIFLCTVAPHEPVSIQHTSEEGFMNRIGINIHTPVWVDRKAFGGIQFRTLQLHQAILDGLQNGFPRQPVELRS